MNGLESEKFRQTKCGVFLSFDVIVLNSLSIFMRSKLVDTLFINEQSLSEMLL